MSKMFNIDIQGVNVFQVVMYFLKKVLTIEILEHTRYFVTLWAPEIMLIKFYFVQVIFSAKSTHIMFQCPKTGQNPSYKK